jgi:hypothetical protein
MAEIGVDRKTAVVERTGFRLSWGAIFAGLFVAIGLHLTLALLGIGIGFTAWDPASPGGADPGNVAAGVGIWTAISGLIALFVGGTTTGRLAGVLTRGDGALHGIILWALTTVVLLWLIISGLGFLLGGAFGIIGRTAAATVETVGGAATGAAGPAITGAVRGEERQTLVDELAARTGLSRAEAEQVVGAAEARARAVRGQAAERLDTLEARAPQIAQDVSDTAARAAWWSLLALGLSLAAAAGGAASTARE